jgi:transcriptional regulator with XRE-family HTH domain
MTPLSDLVAERIRNLRETQGWTQEDLAEASGLSRDAVSRIERGDRGPRLETLEAIACALKIPVTQLLEFKAPRKCLYILRKAGASRST